MERNRQILKAYCRNYFLVTASFIRHFNWRSCNYSMLFLLKASEMPKMSWNIKVSDKDVMTGIEEFCHLTVCEPFFSLLFHEVGKEEMDAILQKKSTDTIIFILQYFGIHYCSNFSLSSHFHDIIELAGVRKLGQFGAALSLLEEIAGSGACRGIILEEAGKRALYLQFFLFTCIGVTTILRKAWMLANDKLVKRYATPAEFKMPEQELSVALKTSNSQELSDNGMAFTMMARKYEPFRVHFSYGLLPSEKHLVDFRQTLSYFYWNPQLCIDVDADNGFSIKNISLTDRQ